MKRTLFVFGAVLALFVVSCGDEDTPDGEVATEAATTSAAATEAVTQAATEAATSVATQVVTGTPPAATPPTGTLEAETPAPPSEPVTSTYYLPAEDLPVVRFHTADGEPELSIEVPPDSEYGIGLSGRTTLGERGMLFYREDFGTTGFWMRNTHIDLDIAFVSADREIVHITTMIADTDDIHRPDEAFVAAIEAPAGWYASHGVAEGDTVEYLFDLETIVPD